ncbi:MAG TPA: O-antigen ligase family protein [Chitinophagaceae bacterium]|nr:O-antigen ligase family protein [Chitinophagaceae bacterium]
MENFVIPVKPAKKSGANFFASLKNTLLVEKLNTPAGYILLAISSVVIAILIAKMGIPGGAMFLVGVMVLPILYAIVAYPKVGIWILLVMAYTLFLIMSIGINFPFGTLMDGLQVLLFLGFFIKQRSNPNWKILKGPVTVMILVWIVYNILEIANPAAESRLAWVYTIRSVALVMLTYFVFLYNVRTVEFIRFIFKTWIILALCAALYGLKQEYIGFSASEEAYLHSDPNIAGLLFIDGHWRKFSFLSDPVAFSYNMVVASVLCMALMSGPIKFWKKVVLGFFVFIYLWAMLTSGTRGAYVLVPVTLVLYAIFKFNRRVLRLGIAAAAFILVVIFIPTSNPTLYRFQSAFKPSKDASFNVRKANQKRIQPYILTHPMGGGLGATGAWGQRFAPNSYLANFPPDSGYVRVAVELGWIGLGLFCTLMFVILKTGINNYYAIRDPELKTYCMAMTLIVFAFNIGNYPQEALVQFPSNVYFYLVTALITVTYQLDKQKNPQLHAG